MDITDQLRAGDIGRIRERYLTVAVQTRERVAVRTGTDVADVDRLKIVSKRSSDSTYEEQKNEVHLLPCIPFRVAWITEFPVLRLLGAAVHCLRPPAATLRVIHSFSAWQQRHSPVVCRLWVNNSLAAAEQPFHSR